MAIRSWAASFAGGMFARSMYRLNARHPWSHNDHFHSWVISRLPTPCTTVLDVGCGRGELAAALAPHATNVVGNDQDPDMRAQAATRCAGLPTVSIVDGRWTDLTGPFDAVCMIAVLHHLDTEAALRDVVRRLAPGGRFLSVGLTRPQSRQDHLWDVVCMVTNPIIGYVKHPWPSPSTGGGAPLPVRDPELAYRELDSIVQRVMPGAIMRRRVGFRHTLEWTK